MSRQEALERLASWPRLRLATLPTPLLSAPRVGEAIGIEDLHVKMDADTGFALGGNKVRKLEFELEPGRLAGVTCLVTAGGPQSNHCRVAAAAAARLGLRCVLVVNGPEHPRPAGNALLHRLFGADIHRVHRREDREPGMDEVAERIAAAGGHALVVPLGASTGLGSLGYAPPRPWSSSASSTRSGRRPVARAWWWPRPRAARWPASRSDWRCSTAGTCVSWE